MFVAVGIHAYPQSTFKYFFCGHQSPLLGGLVAEWLECWTQAQKGPGSNCSRKIGSSPLKGCRVTAGLAESNGSLQSGLWLASPLGWLPRTGISSGTLHSVIEYGLPLPLTFLIPFTCILSMVFFFLSNSQLSQVTYSWVWSLFSWVVSAHRELLMATVAHFFLSSTKQCQNR